MAEPAGSARPRLELDDAAVRERLARLDELLAQVETIPGPAGELALAAVSALAEVYGEALGRASAYAAAAPALLEKITGDELLGHLLVLHGIHPDPVDRRVARVLEQLRPALREQGADVELVGIDQGVATVRLSIKGCSSAAGELENAVRQAVLAIAPELSEVRRAPAVKRRDAAFIPLDALTPRPATPPTATPRPATSGVGL
ncbi:MAG: NifU family protein [Pseudonocardiales bacterium]|nr:NifU family protein [Pseudonocardiales bacterium]